MIVKKINVKKSKCIFCGSKLDESNYGYSRVIGTPNGVGHKFCCLSCEEKGKDIESNVYTLIQADLIKEKQNRAILKAREEEYEIN